MPIINSHNSWSQLEEVWLGDVYPASWYEHLPPNVRDVFQTITEITQQDLTQIEKKLIELDVKVQRPTYSNISDHTDPVTGQLKKPQICPRDWFLTLGNCLLAPNNPDHTWPWADVLTEYRMADNKCLVKNQQSPIINGANVVRVGRDVVIDTDIFDISEIDFNLTPFKDYRLTWVKNGGHMDGCFAILRPGLILANQYFADYEKTFPGWECIFLNEPTYTQHIKYPPRGGGYNGKFYAEEISFNQSFNDHVIRYAQDWVGNYTETYFELNCLVINESNVMMLGYNQGLEKILNQRGITVHWVPFRCRGFWDGGMHCITLDIRRQSSIVDYFPERG